MTRQYKKISNKLCFFVEKMTFLFLFLCIPLKTYAAEKRVFKNISTTPVIILEHDLPPSTQPFLIETSNLTSIGGTTPDTVLRVWDRDILQEIAFNDDRAIGDSSSAVSVMGNATSIRKLLIIVYAYHETRLGYADLKINNTLILQQKFFGGKLLHTNLYSSEKHEFYATVQPGNIQKTFLFAFDCSGVLKAFDIEQNGIGPGSRIQSQENICNLLVSTESEVFDLAVYANDHLNDADGDGLGGKLELELGTCDYHPGVMAAKP